MELLVQVLLLVIGGLLCLWGFNHDPQVVWAIIVGAILLAAGGIWVLIDLD